ncbi:Nuclear factor NF-kappa-B p105 subunit [Homalodisca vitripennis]|nr:Nuclear factor NF-kappa-B p105 subunit [Homalodisca vitripennis]
MSKAYLKIIEQPHAGFRFRYKTEMQGTHGAIFGTQSQKNRSKSFPKVKLCNYKHRPGDNQPFIRCTLFTGDPDVAKRTHHVHRLVCKMTGTVRDDPHDIQVKAPDYVAHFQQMTILYTKKEDQLAVLLEKKQYHTRRRYTDIRNNYDFPIEERGAAPKVLPKPALMAGGTRILGGELRAKCVEEIKSINFHVACLRFEALVDNGKGKYIPLCPPVYSNIINNLKNPQTSELKICRMDQCMGPCQGGQEIFMFVEKVVKKTIYGLSKEYFLTIASDTLVSNSASGNTCNIFMWPSKEVAFITFVPRSFIALRAAVLTTSCPRGVYPRIASIASVGQELIAPMMLKQAIL